MDIISIQGIDEMKMKFNAEVSILLKWKDPRITYENLAKRNNFLDNFWTQKMWLPQLTFSNTNGNHPISIDHDGGDSLEVERIGLPKLNDLSYLNEGNQFSGKENSLLLFTIHQHDFQCIFDLTKFPFDTQKCSIDVQIPKKIRDYTILQPGKLNYSGKCIFVIVVCPIIKI